MDKFANWPKGQMAILASKMSGEMYLILIPIAIVAFIYRVILYEKLKGEPYAGFLATTGYATLKHFIPLKKENLNSDQYRMVKKANISLAIFWLCFILMMLIGLVQVLLKSS